LSKVIENMIIKLEINIKGSIYLVAVAWIDNISKKKYKYIGNSDNKTLVCFFNIKIILESNIRNAYTPFLSKNGLKQSIEYSLVNKAFIGFNNIVLRTIIGYFSS